MMRLRNRGVLANPHSRGGGDIVLSPRRLLGIAVVVVSACHSSSSPPTPGAPERIAGAASAEPRKAGVTSPAPAPSSTERITADTPRLTVEGNRFVAPAGWGLLVQGPATILTPPEGGSQIALVDVHAESADAAVAAAWAAYRLDAKLPLRVANRAPDRDGWKDTTLYAYQTSPNERRRVTADARHAAGDSWTVAISDMAQAIAEKRLAQIQLISGSLQPRGFERESFAGRRAHKLDQARIAALGAFITTAQRELGVPGVSIGVLQDGEVVFADGFGVRELGKDAKVDADTLYMIASNTKALTTLMLAKLVDEGKLTWETPAATLLPSFQLGDAEITSRVLVKHLICACTGLPRQDYEWLFQFKGVTPQATLATLASVRPTSKFGEIFQYSNGLAAAAGLVGGHVAYPELELGAAYDKAMQTRVFGPLGMTSTTFDFGQVARRSHVTPHAPDIDGKPARALQELLPAVIPIRPAGGAWSNVRDILKYVAMELAQGELAGGKRYITADTLLARRVRQVTMGHDVTYGMGLIVDTTYGTPVVHHGGSVTGQYSDMMWLPEHGVGAVVLTNAAPGWLIRDAFRRKLLEVLFDGRPEADAQVAAAGRAFFEEMAAERKLLSVPADRAEAAKLAARYVNDALGEIAVHRERDATVFDFGEWRSEVASRHNPDGSVSFRTIRPGVAGFELVVGAGGAMGAGGPKRTLVIRDAQHEYTFTER